MIVRLDFETRSTVDLRKTGVYPYAEHPSTDIWCMAYAFDDEDPLIWRPGYPIDERLAEHIRHGGELHAWNAQFERIMWRIMVDRYGWPEPKLEQWHCSMALAAAHGLPLQLAAAGKALGIEHEKDREGHDLMMRMCRPRDLREDGSPIWWEVPERVLRLCAYCQQDVRAERDIANMLPTMPERERAIWLFDQRINDRGVRLDDKFVLAAGQLTEAAMDHYEEQLRALTGGEVSVYKAPSYTKWLVANGMNATGVAKSDVADMLTRPSSELVRAVLKIRQESSQSSTSKFDVMQAYRAGDGRMHGMLQYHGAHTGRWAGRGVQPQNFPRGTVADAEWFIPLIEEGDFHAIDLLEPPLAVLSSALRASMVASPGSRFLAADFAAIEARVTAWLAGEGGLVQSYIQGVDVYKQLASRIYGVPSSDVTKRQRFVGKTAILGLGFQMGAKRFRESCAAGGVQLSETESEAVVSGYRDEHPNIKRMWASMEAGMLRAVRDPRILIQHTNGKLGFSYDGERFLRVHLPSGRLLHYSNPLEIDVPTPWGETRRALQVKTVNEVTRQFDAVKLYGGLITENVVQAVARDILADAMLRVEAAGYPVVLTVHDEVVSERPEGEGSLEEFVELMQQVPEWAAGCPINVEGWEGKRYRK